MSLVTDVTRVLQAIELGAPSRLSLLPLVNDELWKGFGRRRRLTRRLEQLTLAQ